MKPNEVIKELINKHGLSQQAIADYLECHQTAVSQWLLATRTMKMKYAVPLIKMARKKGMKVRIEDFVS